MGGACLLIASFITIFIRHQHKIVKQQQQLYQEQLNHQQELTRAVIESQETERIRIGQDLHDDVGTALSGLRLTIEMMGENDIGSLTSFRQTCKKQIDQTINRVRHIAHNLSPQNITLYGFIGAVEDLCETISETGALHISLSNLCEDLFDGLNSITQISLYRVIEELLNNTIKHAAATTVVLEFTNDQHAFYITYHDNGKNSFDPTTVKKGMGLHNIESRLGIIGATYHFNHEAKGFHLHISLNN